MNDNNRRYFSPEQKVAILREHLIEGKAVSDLCDKHHIQPTVFYQWQRQFFENGTAAFESKQSRSRVSDGYQKKIEALERNSLALVHPFFLASSSEAAVFLFLTERMRLYLSSHPKNSVIARSRLH